MRKRLALLFSTLALAAVACGGDDSSTGPSSGAGGRGSGSTGATSTGSTTTGTSAGAGGGPGATTGTGAGGFSFDGGFGFDGALRYSVDLTSGQWLNAQGPYGYVCGTGPDVVQRVLDMATGTTLRRMASLSAPGCPTLLYRQSST